MKRRSDWRVCLDLLTWVIVLPLCGAYLGLAFAQDPNTPISKLRQQGRDLFENVYRRPEVVKFCADNPEGSITVRLNGDPSHDFTVDCIARRAYMALAEAGVR